MPEDEAEPDGMLLTIDSETVWPFAITALPVAGILTVAPSKRV